jgi:hypothetical protein
LSRDFLHFAQRRGRRKLLDRATEAGVVVVVAAVCFARDPLDLLILEASNRPAFD